MREQRFNKIKKTVFILLAVFLVVSLTAASASAWYSKTSDGKCKVVAKEEVKEAKEKPVKEVVKEKAAKKVVKEKAAKKVVKEKAAKKVVKEKAVEKVAKEKVVKQAVRERVFDRKVCYEKLDKNLLGFTESYWFCTVRGGNCGNCCFGNNWDDC
ncbi:hypothetical protein ASJ81_08195 [Methanosarcina spelaei]|uniref:Uncharacterized protein n=1 Tax=Methanosarcina spelaei TaxID=1036679 RepID=A0A2A2HRF3_9EURY|nr:hypothetical protein [Methanosarcina spelaei]PAV12007.1 hypothetical protein ASJ81_08195 [Methanosarcina spelaei]